MGIKFKLELNLQQMASIRIAANIWLSRPMIAKMSKFFSRNNISYKTPNNYCDATFEMGMKKWLIDIFEQVDSMKLPYAIKNDLLHVMKPVGENLLDYLRRICLRWNCFLKKQSFPGFIVYCKYIDFDCIGRVDEIKTFLNIYNASENISLLFLFFEACTYCLEEVIHSIWNKSSERIKFDIQFVLSSSLGFDESDIHKIQQYWLQFVDNNQSKLPFEITVIDALRNCYKKANNVGLEYFMKKLKQDIQNRIIVPLAQKLLQNELSGYKTCKNEKQYIRILFFYLSQMTENDRNKIFISNKVIIIYILFREWPWKYLLLDYLDKESYCISSKFIVQRIVYDYNVYKKIVHTDLWMVSEIWKKFKNNLEENIDEIFQSMKLPIVCKPQAIQVILLASVINNTDKVIKLRPEICEDFKHYCNQFLNLQKYEIVDSYLKNKLKTSK